MNKNDPHLWPIRQILFLIWDHITKTVFFFINFLVFTLSSIMSRNMCKLHNNLHFCMNCLFLLRKTHVWHLTCDTWTFSQNFKCLAYTVLVWRCFEYTWTKGWPTKLINQFIKYKGVCRTGPTTPGLLKNINPSLFVICFVY